MSKELCQKLGYSFKHLSLLKLALTHRSTDGQENNERLEFLGDSIVNFIIAEALYQQFPQAEEGQLSRQRASLINRNTLCRLAQDFQLGNYLFLGPGEIKNGGSERPSILSCAMEAIIGAIYLDSGFAAIQECVMRWYHPLLQSLSHSAIKDPKTELQELLQQSNMPLPLYKVESVEGKSHQQTFIVSCSIPNTSNKTLAKGSSRRRAEQEAAERMLGTLKK